MGFKKTEKGNIIYEFDFTPTKLVPITSEVAGGPTDIYRIEGDNTETAPVQFEFQGERYRNYGFVFCSRIDKGHEQEKCIIVNYQLVSTLDKLYQRSSTEQEFDPWACDLMAKNGVRFEVDSLQDAQDYIRKNKLPLDGYDLLRKEI